MTIIINYLMNHPLLSDDLEKALVDLLTPELEYRDLAGGEVNVIFSDNQMLQQLNRDYRSKDIPTDVLSFSYLEHNSDESEPGIEDRDNFAIGDIYISLDKAQQQAEEAGHNPERELVFLAVHGFLHLLGFDHGDDPDEARMKKVEAEIMEKFDLNQINGS